MTDSQLSPDLVDACVPLAEGSTVHAVRHQRDKVAAATQGSYEALFDPALSGPPLVERLLAAHAIARSAGSRCRMCGKTTAPRPGRPGTKAPSRAAMPTRC